MENKIIYGGTTLNTVIVSVEHTKTETVVHELWFDED